MDGAAAVVAAAAVTTGEGAVRITARAAPLLRGPLLPEPRLPPPLPLKEGACFHGWPVAE